MECSKSGPKKKVYSNRILPQETRKTLKRQPNFIQKQLENENLKNPKVNNKKEIIKIKTEINKKEMKEAIVKINQTKSWFFEKIKLTNLGQIHQEEREKTQINKTRSEKGEVTTNSAKIQRIIRYYYQQLNGQPGRKGQLRKAQSSKTEPGRNRNYEQPSYKH